MNSSFGRSGGKKVFASMGLHESLVRGLYQYGYDKLSAIQQRGISAFCNGLDVIQQPDRGKNVTLCAGILQQIDYNLNDCQALVLSPTRELAQHIGKVMRALGNYLEPKVHTCVGGTDGCQDQKSGVHVVVGTPGGVYDMLRRRAVRADYIKMFVLDEADEMFSRGFKDQICDIFQLLPSKVQVGIFSATMPEALEITRKFMNKPVHIIPIKRALEGIKEFYMDVGREERKLEYVFDLFDALTIMQMVIFCNTRQKVDWLTDKMRSHEYCVSATHGDMDQNQRDVIMQEWQEFGSARPRVLITTDMVAQGILDVQQVLVVVNYDLPHPEIYLHRFGGRKAVVISVITNEDARMLHELQEFCNTVIEALPAEVSNLIM